MKLRKESRKMIVNNFKNDKGKPIANQFIINFHDWEIFQSYSSIIAVTKQSSSYILLDEKFHNYSVTTSRYLYLFLNMNRKEINFKYKQGYIRYCDLNQYGTYGTADNMLVDFINEQVQEIHKKRSFIEVFGGV